MDDSTGNCDVAADGEGKCHHQTRVAADQCLSITRTPAHVALLDKPHHPHVLTLTPARMRAT